MSSSSPCLVLPRPYQAGALGRVGDIFHQGEKSALVVMPTGTGKTTFFGLMARREISQGGRVLVLAHRDVLLQQALEDLERCGVASVIEKADQKAMDAILADSHALLPRHPRCVIASVATLHARRLESWPRDYFSLIVCDEAHHSSATSYTRIYRHFSSAKLLGVTATPDRADGQNIGAVFPRLAYEYSLPDAIRDGWLVRLFVEKCNTRIDLRGIDVKPGEDWNDGDLADRIGPQIELMANAAKEKIGDRPTIVFCPKVKTAQAFADGLEKVGLSARASWGLDYRKEETLRAFRAGDFQCLVNVALLTEGYNAPWVRAVVIARPTRSRGLLAQMIGRVTRLYDGKTDGMIVDYGWVLDDHNIVKPASLVAPRDAKPKAVRLAEEMVDSGYEPDLMEAFEQASLYVEEEEAKARQSALAEEERKARQQREMVRVKVQARPSHLTWTRYDPVGLSALDLVGLKDLEPLPPSAPRATSAQVRGLISYQVSESEARSLSEREATRLLLSLQRRERDGMATLRQVRFLELHGVPHDEAWALGKISASWEIDRIKRRLVAG